jgi:CRP-like cAMP-binding protein
LVRAAGKVLFRAGDTDDDCYRVEDGLLKVAMVSPSGAAAEAAQARRFADISQRRCAS